MPHWMFNVLFPVNRWIHLVASTLLVGGVLFFELVVPLATADLREEQRLAVFGRARWVFRKIVWLSVIGLALSGGVSLWRMWLLYQADEEQAGGFWVGPRPWVAGHSVLALAAFVIALRVTHTRKLHGHAVGWMRGLMVVLLVCMFAGSVIRQVRLHLQQLREQHNLPHEPSRGEAV